MSSSGPYEWFFVVSSGRCVQAIWLILMIQKPSSSEFFWLLRITFVGLRTTVDNQIWQTKFQLFGCCRQAVWPILMIWKPISSEFLWLLPIKFGGRWTACCSGSQLPITFNKPNHSILDAAGKPFHWFWQFENPTARKFLWLLSIKFGSCRTAAVDCSHWPNLLN